MDDPMTALIVWLSQNFDWNSVLIVFLISIVLVWIYKSPDMYSTKSHDMRTASAAQQLQIDHYYRASKGEDIEKNLDWWTEFLVDPVAKANELSGGVEGNPDKEHVKLLNDRLQFIMQYGSARTVRLLSFYMGHTYLDELKPSGTLVSVAYIVASLRSDYTGQSALPMDLLKIKFNDYLQNERDYRSVCKTIKKETGIDDHLNYRRLK